uniref:Tail collar domain protein n=1 Tax=Mimivirus LCMiAC01 TaxID=2506608 RepID=A0A481Z0P9_9VIRU|nr:MAG: tail collar domain protein [Mimivirus LCMiAC01]
MIFSKKITIIIMIVSLIIIFSGIEHIWTKQIIEGVDNTSNNVVPCSCEALQNLASLYNDKTMTLNDLTVNGTFNLLPKGIIVAWTGTEVPKGWALCDGKTKGTPNLVGRFIFGGSVKESTMKKMGGSEQMPSHSHSLTGECVGGACPQKGVSKGPWGVFHQNPTPKGEFKGTYHTNVAGTGTAGNMPPYYVLAYIMKL